VDVLVEIAIESAKTAKVFGKDPNSCLLSYSTKGSGSGENVDKVRNATEKIKEKAPELGRGRGSCSLMRRYPPCG
jgi:phosphate acetyltransferase